MNILMIVMIVFIILESLNVLTLYFAPGSKKGNGIGVFNAWEQSKDNPSVHALVRYLVNWVAGTKLIFIGLLIVIIVTGTQVTQLYAVVVMILSILSFFWRLYPSIKEMDSRGEITPKGYSKTLGIMIAVFILGFVSALVVFMN